MAADLQIRDIEKGLMIRVREEGHFRWVLVNFAGAAVFLYIFLHLKSQSKLFFALVIEILAVSTIRSVFAELRGTGVELDISDDGFESKGHAPGGYLPCRILREDIYSLEFRNSCGGGDFPELPMGLYVIHYGGSRSDSAWCVLPHIDKTQTEEVIRAIRNRFLDIDDASRAGPFNHDLISLNLNSPKRD